MDTTLAYLAGAIDFKGMISIGRKKAGNRMLYGVRMALFHPSPLVPQLLFETFSGRLSQIRPKNGISYCIWELSHHRAKEPLSRLLPYLKIKRRHAEIAIELIDLATAQDEGRPSNRPVSSEQEAARRALYEEISKLNGATRMGRLSRHGRPASDAAA